MQPQTPSYITADSHFTLTLPISHRHMPTPSALFVSYQPIVGETIRTTLTKPNVKYIIQEYDETYEIPAFLFEIITKLTNILELPNPKTIFMKQMWYAL